MTAPAAPLISRLRAEIADLKDQLAAAQRAIDTDYEQLYREALADKELAVAVGVREIRFAIKPFADCVNNSSGRIPIEKLSLHDWHKLTYAYSAELSPAAIINQVEEYKLDAERYRYAQKRLRIGIFHRDPISADCCCDCEDWDDAAIDKARGTK